MAAPQVNKLARAFADPSQAQCFLPYRAPFFVPSHLSMSEDNPFHCLSLYLHTAPLAFAPKLSSSFCKPNAIDYIHSPATRTCNTINDVGIWTCSIQVDLCNADEPNGLQKIHPNSYVGQHVEAIQPN
jgi:hypothetical protein